MQTDGATLHVLVSKQTTVEIRIARPITVALPRDRTAEITTVRLYADDSAGLVAVVRARRGGPLTQRLPRFSCSRSIASKRALKLPLPKPSEPCRSMSSKNTVGRSCTGLVKICSR